MPLCNENAYWNIRFKLVILLFAWLRSVFLFQNLETVILIIKWISEFIQLNIHIQITFSVLRLVHLMWLSHNLFQECLHCERTESTAVGSSDVTKTYLAVQYEVKISFCHKAMFTAVYLTVRLCFVILLRLKSTENSSDAKQKLLFRRTISAS